MKEQDVDQLFDDPYLALAAKSNIATITFLKTKIRDIEKAVVSHIGLKPAFKILPSIPGIGAILALTIMLEVDGIKRFAKAGNFASYSRCVKAERLSDEKKKGQGNRKNGNKYLAWAYVEAAHFIVRYCPEANRFYQQKRAK